MQSITANNFHLEYNKEITFEKTSNEFMLFLFKRAKTFQFFAKTICLMIQLDIGFQIAKVNNLGKVDSKTGVYF